ncbi:hypothetical protein N7519_007816 [Penicillium mononematosum]|uniref:uncharacterized protein n=1 Tax=Penicillium mononematosum TaxID=268346 RepID=UPI0025492DFA|nr:uncharacterized protein N7519_007816 [Penicillium mononematosum]KAJ6186515.1 hypothetical protein N7519_007816 [Penicillium mononematosum]
MGGSKPINRITLFKIPSPDDQKRLFDIFRIMLSDAVKDGKPYILGVCAGPSFDDARNQGYTLAVISTFKSVEDMEYYDNECEAHQALKKVAKTLHNGAMMVYFQDVLK